MTPEHPANPQKQRRGLNRMLHATRYSWHGLRAAWSEAAFRQESCAALVLDEFRAGKVGKISLESPEV